MHWRSFSKDNVLTLYGKDPHSRIADPADPVRIFAWLICETRDDKGNAIVYDYKAEEGHGAGLDLGQLHERNRGDRDDRRRAANRYLKRIRYGNRVPLLDVGSGARPRQLSAPEIESADWMFEVVFDYGEHDANDPHPSDNPTISNSRPWPVRPDRFSSHRAGFEVRTCRLCQRVLMFHHFPDELGIGANCLVRSTDFDYSSEANLEDARNPVYSFLLAATQTGYRRTDTGGYLARSLPRVEFLYSPAAVQQAVHEIDPASLENLPAGLEGTRYQLADVHGEGLPGVLAEQAGELFYKRNLSPLSEAQRVEFAVAERVAVRPNLALAGDQAQFMDLAGDGLPGLVVMDGPMPGLYEHDDGEGWQPFRPFAAQPNCEAADPNLKLVDLDGDGRPDVLNRLAIRRRADPVQERGWPAEHARRLDLHGQEGGGRDSGAAPRWELPTLLVWGGADRIVPPEGSRAFALAAPRAHVTAHEYPGLYHELFNETEKAAVLAELTRWLERFS
jgi:hypothetical protein